MTFNGILSKCEHVLRENALIQFAFIKITLVSALPSVKSKDVHREACKCYFTVILKWPQVQPSCIY